MRYKHLITTAPLKDLLKKVSGLPIGIVDKAKHLKAKTMIYLDVALNIPAQQKYHWCYVPSSKVPFYRVGIYSNFSDKLVPKGKSSLYVELTAQTYNPRVIPEVISELTNMGIIRGEKDIQFIVPRSVPYAYVTYNKEHSRVVPAIHTYLRKHDIHSIGRWGDWNYSSMEDAILMGRDTAQKIEQS